MNIWRRLRNIWALGAYRPTSNTELLNSTFKTLVPDVPTVHKKLATIIPPDKPDPFEEAHD